MHDFQTFVDYVLYTKRLEYGIAFAFMIVFAFFYTFLRTTTKEQVARAVERVAARIQGFLVPDGVFFHQGHAWARAEGDDIAAVGIDDFATKLVGKVDKFNLPEIGSNLAQGEKAWTMYIDSKPIDMLSPVGGKVVAVNWEALKSPDVINSDPYGKGWLLKVQTPKASATLKNLLSGELARKWTEKVISDLMARANYNLGTVLADGGFPVNGMAKNLDSEKWDEIVKEFLLTKGQ